MYVCTVHTIYTYRTYMCFKMLKSVVGGVEVGKLYNKLQCKGFNEYNLLDEAEDIRGVRDQSSPPLWPYALWGKKLLIFSLYVMDYSGAFLSVEASVVYCSCWWGSFIILLALVPVWISVGSLRAWAEQTLTPQHRPLVWNSVFVGVKSCRFGSLVHGGFSSFRQDWFEKQCRWIHIVLFF